MAEPIFFRRAVTPTLSDILCWAAIKAPDGADLSQTIDSVAPINEAGPGALAFLDNPKYATDLAQCRATACLVAPRFLDRIPAGTVALVSPEPYRAFAQIVAHLYPDAMRPSSNYAVAGIAPGAHVHPDAWLEDNVIVDPGAVIGPRAEIGEGTIIGANCVIGPDVRIGRKCSIGTNTTVVYALIGDRVILHAGVRVGQDGFGFAMGMGGHVKVPQTGRVIIQNDCDIGSNTTIDRGANRDTVLGEGTKIDNLVQIGHNTTLGRHCVIVSQVGISGSTEIGDYVVIGGQTGIAGHLRIGTGAQIAACSGVMNDVPSGEKWGGSPARPLRDFWRKEAAVEKLARRKSE